VCALGASEKWWQNNRGGDSTRKQKKKEREEPTVVKRSDALECNLKLVWVGEMGGVVEDLDLRDVDDRHYEERAGW
jgi:hypothetical protein